MTDDKNTLIVITGPTASGKSALAVRLARELGCDIISADSRQVYTDIPIVTAQPSVEERAGVTHHLMGHLPLDAYYSAALFEEDALRLTEESFARSGYAIVCGGSMLYVDALCHGIDRLPTVSESLRQSLISLHSQKGDEWLLSRLQILDPPTFSRIDRNNIKRVFHAVEISLQAGRPYSSLLTGNAVKRPFRIFKAITTAPREILFDRINRRVIQMLNDGLLDEARKVYHLKGLNSLNTVGLKEIFAHFDGEMTLDEAIARIQKNTRVFAKKQLTWLKKGDGRSFLMTDSEDTGITTATIDITSPDPYSDLTALL